MSVVHLQIRLVQIVRAGKAAVAHRVIKMQNFRDTVKFLYAGTKLEGRMLEIMNYIFENYQI